MKCKCDEYRNLLEDVVNELDLSGAAIAQHGPLGTPPAELVRLVLQQKDLEIAALKHKINPVNHSCKVGDKVHYQPEHYGEDRWENGIIKVIKPEVKDGVWVVYNCAGNWDRYMDYTSAKTNFSDLKKGWR